MDQDVLVAAITGHLDALQLYLNAILLLAAAAAWGGLRRTPDSEAFGLKFDRRHAFWIFGGAYLVANVGVLISFLRLGNLLKIAG